MDTGERQLDGHHIVFIQGRCCPLKWLSFDLQDHLSCNFIETISGFDGIKGCAGTLFDAMLLDLDFGTVEKRGEVIGEARRRGLTVLGLSRNEDRASVLLTISQGLSGYLLKEEVSCDTIIAAINDIKQGGTPVSPRVARHLSRFVRQNYDCLRVHKISTQTGL